MSHNRAIIGLGDNPGPTEREPENRGLVVNGVRIDVVAKLIGHGDDVTATPREREIAKKARQVGEKLERDGYLPELRRRHMLRVIASEAQATKVEQPS